MAAHNHITTSPPLHHHITTSPPPHHLLTLSLSLLEQPQSPLLQARPNPFLVRLRPLSPLITCTSSFASLQLAVEPWLQPGVQQDARQALPLPPPSILITSQLTYPLSLPSLLPVTPWFLCWRSSLPSVSLSPSSQPPSHLSVTTPHTAPHNHSLPPLP